MIFENWKFVSEKVQRYKKAGSLFQCLKEKNYRFFIKNAYEAQSATMLLL